MHIFGYPADMPAFEQIAQRHGLAIVEDACEALGARHADGPAVGGARQPGGVRLLRQQAADDRRGGDGHARRRGDARQRIDSERNQGRAPDMGWLDHDRLGFNYRLSDIACALGIAQLRAPRRDARRARGASPSSTARRWPAIEGLQLPCADAGGDVRGWFVFVVQLPRGRRPRRDGRARSRPAGIQSKPYLPAIHLMSFYRERFGHREGEFPVCEDVAARSLALPFFPRDVRGAGRAGGARELRDGARPLSGRSRRLVDRRGARPALPVHSRLPACAIIEGEPRSDQRGGVRQIPAPLAISSLAARPKRRSQGARAWRQTVQQETSTGEIAGLSRRAQRCGLATSRPIRLLPAGRRCRGFAQAAIWALRPLDLMDRCAERYGEIFTLRVRRGSPWVLISNPEHVKLRVHRPSRRRSRARRGRSQPAARAAAGVQVGDAARRTAAPRRPQAPAAVVSRRPRCATTAR